jgi:hypothetical protein
MRVKSPSEILNTLDADGKLDGLPFMPEMVVYCGSYVRVHRSARRTCVVGHGFREMKDAVFLQDARCDGSFHDHCHRACLLFWKKEWLAPAEAAPVAQSAWSAHDAAAAERLRRLPTRDGARYACQSTALKSATTPLHRWDVRPLLREILARELSLSDFVRILYRTLRRRASGGNPERQLIGVPGQKSRGSLELRRDEWVTLKPIHELRNNLDEKGRNCGLGFPPTMHHAIGRTYRVAFPVRQIILEQTGMMVKLSNTVALDGLLCEGVDVANCPRGEYLYCRESWLRRTAASADRLDTHRA